MFARLAGYRPFVGHPADPALIMGNRVIDGPHVQSVFNELDHLNVVCVLPDYPSLSPREDTGNPIYPYIDEYVKSRFEVVTVVSPEYSYPYTFAHGVTVYRRPPAPATRSR